MAAGQRDYQLCLWVLYETGARIGEVLRLQKKDLLDQGELGGR